jgi:hypothetical protein
MLMMRDTAHRFVQTVRTLGMVGCLGLFWWAVNQVGGSGEEEGIQLLGRESFGAP